MGRLRGGLERLKAGSFTHESSALGCGPFTSKVPPIPAYNSPTIPRPRVSHNLAALLIVRIACSASFVRLSEVVLATHRAEKPWTSPPLIYHKLQSLT